METRNQVIDFIKDQCVWGNSVVYATIGEGGAGLTESSYDFTEDLEDMDFDGKVGPTDVCDDIKSWVEYDETMYSVYQFSDDNGSKFQVVAFY